jgi:hypothetical protein
VPKLLQVVSSFAPIIASGAAVYVAWKIGQAQITLGRRQADTAELQAALANVRLKHDVFDRRYKIYETVFMFLIKIAQVNNISDEGIGKFVRGTSRAVFFFDQDVVDYLDHLRR